MYVDVYVDVDVDVGKLNRNIAFFVFLREKN